MLAERVAGAVDGRPVGSLTGLHVPLQTSKKSNEASISGALLVRPFLASNPTSFGEENTAVACVRPLQCGQCIRVIAQAVLGNAQRIQVTAVV